MSIRRLRADHAKSVKEIWEASFLRETLSVQKDFASSWRNRSRQESIGLFNGDILLGFAIVSFHKRNMGNRYIDYIAVDSTYRGRGYGDKLMRHLLAQARSARRGIHLYPLKHVVPWYTKHGFYWTTDEYMNHHHHDQRGCST
jgi:ribosomal protein S18 acetylase RimI-like enzyme